MIGIVHSWRLMTEAFLLVGNKANTKSVEWTLGCSQLACAINKERTSHSVGEALAGSAHH